MHLYTTLQQAIGLKSTTINGIGIFGTRVISVEFTSIRALALKNANAISKENLAFITLKSSISKNCKGKYCKFFAILATVQF